MIRVYIVAPALAVRAGLRALLNSSGSVEVTGESASLADVPGPPAETDVLVLALEEISGAELSHLLPAGAAVLYLVEDRPEAVQALPGLQARAWGVLPLDSSAEELWAAVNALNEGLFVGAAVLMRPLIGRLVRAEEVDAGALVEPLTEREAEVLQLLAQGLANKQIAASLGISEHTVKFHASAIFSKLGAASRTEAVRIGVQRGLVVL